MKPDASEIVRDAVASWLERRRRGSMPVRLFHRTTPGAAQRILREGFRDAVGMFLTNRQWRGVWLSEAPNLGLGEISGGGELLAVELDVPLVDLAAFEWVEEGKPYREWLVPADYIREHAVRIGVLDAA